MPSAAYTLPLVISRSAGALLVWPPTLTTITHNTGSVVMAASVARRRSERSRVGLVMNCSPGSDACFGLPLILNRRDVEVPDRDVNARIGAVHLEQRVLR